jgi:hypothetical protein
MAKKDDPKVSYATARMELEMTVCEATNKFMAQTGKRAIAHIVAEPWIAPEWPTTPAPK